MLSVYTRHAATCPRKGELHWRRCRYPKWWINGTIESGFMRKTAKLVLGRRQKSSTQWEEAENPRKAEPVTIEKAVESYLADAKACELREATIWKLETIFRKQFLAWTKAKGFRLLKQIDLTHLREFRSTWKDGALAKKKQERLVGFFWFCVRAGWLTANATDGLGRIAVDPLLMRWSGLRKTPSPLNVRA